jgi:hypothetical protein
MKVRILFALFCVAFWVGQYGFAQGGWKQFSSKEGRFSVQLPGDPKQGKQSIDTQAGKIDMHLFTYEVSKEVAYIVIFNDYPAAIVEKANKNKMLDGARDGAVKKVKGTLRGEKKLTMNGSPGREVVVDTPQLSFRNKMFMVKNRLYQVMAVTPKGKDSTADVMKFLNSFKLTQ